MGSSISRGWLLYQKYVKDMASILVNSSIPALGCNNGLADAYGHQEAPLTPLDPARASTRIYDAVGHTSKGILREAVGRIKVSCATPIAESRARITELQGSCVAISTNRIDGRQVGAAEEKASCSRRWNPAAYMPQSGLCQTGLVRSWGQGIGRVTRVRLDGKTAPHTVPGVVLFHFRASSRATRGRHECPG